MAHLVGDDIGLREITGRAVTAPEFIEEREIDVDLRSPGQ
jgi:hypothetical protein